MNAESKRFQDGEIDFIKKISQDKNLGNIPIVIVLTQCIDNGVKDKMIEVIKQENLTISAIVPVLAQKKEINMFGGQMFIQPFGLDDLINTSKELIPEILKKTLTILTNQSLYYKRLISHGIIVVGTLFSAAVSTDLIPYTNPLLAFPSDILMCCSISLAYGTDLSLKFIISYIKWKTAKLNLTKETYLESLKPAKVTFSDSNDVDYNFINEKYIPEIKQNVYSIFAMDPQICKFISNKVECMLKQYFHSYHNFVAIIEKIN